MGQDIPASQLSLYLHIPFCLTRCGYCSFFSVPYVRDELNKYVSCLCRELAMYAGLLQQPLSTLYLGGGTPSLLSPSQINTLISHVQLAPDAEITLEINPLQITAPYLEGLRATPVNRLSIGLQSMHEDELQWLSRRHIPTDIAPKLQLCRASGYQNISLDLIYGLPIEITGTPKHTLCRLKDNLDNYIALAPEHISCYLLSIDENCAIHQDTSRSYSLPNDDLAARQYELIRQSLRQAGFQHYEISNFALPGYQSRHNLVYWQGGNYLAAGAAAAGLITPWRYQNPADLPDYYALLSQHRMFNEDEQLSDFQLRQDALMMGLRLIDGIDIAQFNRLHHCDLLADYGTKIAQLRRLGMLKLQHGHMALTSKALFVSNAVIGELMA